jgi:3-phenylpropionate/trans-cinnamate dioxygenase ferredoxin reductase component
MAIAPTFVIAGASLAGASAATAARDSGYDGRIVLVGEESELPYERPPLSKAVLQGKAEPETADVHDAAHYAERDIELLAARTVTALDPGRREVTLDGDEPLAFTSALLTTGSTPRRLDLPGSDLDGIHYLRSRVDSLRLRDALRPGARVAVIGAGWIGSEVAASARVVGADVVLVEPLTVPLERVLGTEMGGVFARLHADHGVDLRLGTGIAEFQGTDRVEAVVLSDGAREPVDLAVVGIGIVPRTDLAEAAGLAVDNGVVVDEYLQTEAPGVYAAGDVASAWHPHYRRHIRVEHWANALNQGRTAGTNAAGGREAYERIPYFFSDQYDLGMEYVGLNEPDDEVAVRGDVESREFIVFWRRDGRVTAAMNVNIWDVVDDLRAIVASDATIDPRRLTDPDVPLGDLAGERGQQSD